MITQEYLKTLLEYRDGKLYWKARRSSNANIGDEAGCVRSNMGYRVIRIDGRPYYSHRLVWLYHYGYLPEGCIDHIDRNSLNNKLENLREVSNQCNSRNCKLSSNNTSGITGVGWFKKVSKWRSDIRINGKQIFLGDYFDIVDAVAARLAAEQCVDWSGCDSTSPAFLFMEEYVKRA